MAHQTLLTLSEVEQTGPAEPALAALAQHYFGGCDPAETLGRGASYLHAVVLAHLRLLRQAHASGQPALRVFNPGLDEDGFSAENSVVMIVQADRPFLVDSVTMTINRCGHTVHWVVHPLFGVEPVPGSGDLALCSHEGFADRLTSFMMVELDRLFSEADAAVLAAELVRTLQHLKVAVTDWPAMVRRVEDRLQGRATTSASTTAGDEGAQYLHWLQDNHFTFLAACDYVWQIGGPGPLLQPQPTSALGLAGEGGLIDIDADVPPAPFDSDGGWVWVGKAMIRSTVHRPAWLDWVIVKRWDESGREVGETRFWGLYTSRTYAAPVDQIPLMRRKAQHVIASAHVVADSHAAKALHAILMTYPRDEFFQADTPTLVQHALGILRLQERQRTRLFVRQDAMGRFVSALVFVPRESYNTELRKKMGQVLLNELGGESLEFTPMLTESPMARVHYRIRTSQTAQVLPDVAAVERQIAAMAQRWDDKVRLALIHLHGEAAGLALDKRFAKGFGALYQSLFDAPTAARDATTLAGLTAHQPMAVQLYRAVKAGAGEIRLKLYHSRKVNLSDSLPVLEHLGVKVQDEQPLPVSTADGKSFWIHDLGLQWPADAELAQVKLRFEALLLQVWSGEVDSDALNKLVLVTTLDAQDIAVLRAYTRYFRQLGFAFSRAYLEATLFKHPAITQALCDLFMARFNPQASGERSLVVQQQTRHIEDLLGQVESLDEDRILRQYLGAITATLRTNRWQVLPSGAAKPVLSFKFDPRHLPGVPEPKPMFEIWVYSSRMEGVHLRGGKVARGGLRWSDRPEDFRTEVLGLVKAQQVKNTVIVPVGSKGGFVLKKAPPAGDREAFMAEGVACYRLFLSGMLDLTDNWVAGQVVAPVQTVCHDAPDPYLVVAADKGTASFSDYANALSAQYGFWLGDAFASGGSQGYDHKKMAITARGAWESAKRHFRALGQDIQTSDFTAVGIGDMSGDVFGNGMLLSPHLRLLAAFDHRHIFLDPNPDPAISLQERQRLFALPRSSWLDYNPQLISAGGGVYPRSAKSIALSEPMRQALGVQATELTPQALLQAILLAPVDLLYNGGIGTYVKASSETHAQVGDKAADAYRVNGADLRCRVVVEGGNLGCTQLGRIEYARKGGLIYTDAVDNSGGVDCSDHEVNIKILLDRLVESGELTTRQRNELLVSMTDEVARLVLTDNYYQTQALDVACHHAARWLDGQQRLIQWLEGAGRLHRALEFLPPDAELQQRKLRGEGLAAPEQAVLLAYAKMAIFDDLVASSLPDDPYFAQVLQAYFPHVLAQRFPQAIALHPLRREIIATALANTLVNRVGATFVNVLAAESMGSTADVVRAYTLAREVFDLEAIWDRIDALDAHIRSDLQLDLLARLIAMAQRASRWLLRRRRSEAQLPDVVATYQGAARTLRGQLANWLPASDVAAWEADAQGLIAQGVQAELARTLCALPYGFAALDMVDLSQQTAWPLEQVAQTYFSVDAHLGLGGWRQAIARLPTHSLWQTQARASARDDVYAVARQLTAKVAHSGQSLADWLQAHAPAVSRLVHLQQMVQSQAPDLAPISVALRELKFLAE
jgi:glutamate dehydrogenase